jgi:hypothetical protein
MESVAVDQTGCKASYHSDDSRSQDTAEKTRREAQDPTQSIKSSVTPSCGESCDNYPRIVVMLADDWRVIECSDGIQWVIQRRFRGARPWRPVYYRRTKAGLLLYARPLTPELLALPDRFPEVRYEEAQLEQRAICCPHSDHA